MNGEDRGDLAVYGPGHGTGEGNRRIGRRLSPMRGKPTVTIIRVTGQRRIFLSCAGVEAAVASSAGAPPYEHQGRSEPSPVRGRSAPCRARNDCLSAASPARSRTPVVTGLAGRAFAPVQDRTGTASGGLRRRRQQPCSAAGLVPCLSSAEGHLSRPSSSQGVPPDGDRGGVLDVSIALHKHQRSGTFSDFRE